MLRLKNNVCMLFYDTITNNILCIADKNPLIVCNHKGCALKDCIVEVIQLG